MIAAVITVASVTQRGNAKGASSGTMLYMWQKRSAATFETLRLELEVVD